MRDKLRDRTAELTPNLEHWAETYAKSHIHAMYPSYWYKGADLAKCYCLGKNDDAFPCPHCQDLSEWEKKYVQPALVAELVKWWRMMMFMDSQIKFGPAKHLENYLKERCRAAYALYALQRRQVAVDVYGSDFLVKDQQQWADCRNAVLRSASPPPPAPAPRISNMSPLQRTDLFQAYARHLKNAAGLEASGVNAEGDVILVDADSLKGLVDAPCRAGYAINEATLVIKIAASDLLNRLPGGGDGASADGSAPCAVADWLEAALGDPTRGRGMCSSFGYSHDPGSQGRGRAGLSRW